MGIHTDTYIIVGTDVGPTWGRLPTDGGDRDPYDDWHDRWGFMVIYEPKPGDFVTFSDIDTAHYRYIGRVIKMDKGRWSNHTEFFESFDVERLTKEIEEVTVLLKEKCGVEGLPVQLHIISNAT